MSGGNNIPRYAKVNREDELAPLKFRGIPFKSPDQINTNGLPGTLTPDQVMGNLISTTSSGVMTFPPANSVISNPSSLGLLSTFSTKPGTEWEISYTNFAVGNTTLSFPLGYIVSPTLNLTVQSLETRILHFRVINSSILYVY